MVDPVVAQAREDLRQFRSSTIKSRKEVSDVKRTTRHAIVEAHALMEKIDRQMARYIAWVKR
jgi:hypothetical protein